MAGADRLIVRHKVSIIQLLPESYKARMERIPGVVLATHQTWFGGIYQDPKNFFMQCPVVPEEFLRHSSGIHPAAGAEKGLAANPHRRRRGPENRRAVSLENRRQSAHSVHHLVAGQTAAALGSSISWAFLTAGTRGRTPPRCSSATIISTKRAVPGQRAGRLVHHPRQRPCAGRGNGETGGQGI